MEQESLFDEIHPRKDEVIGDGALLMRQFVTAQADELIALIKEVAKQSPWRHLETPGGYRMSVAMTNCGSLGWVSDRRGYRYEGDDPQRQQPWPVMPEAYRELAREAAAYAGYDDFEPEACLINRYAPGARMSLHQDKDEKNLAKPIVSVSLGLPCRFLWGGQDRGDKVARFPLHHGDVMVWGGPTRLIFHGVAPLAGGAHPATGEFRYNITFRQATQ